MIPLAFANNGGPSRPVWGAWIEILVPCYGETPSAGRAPYGARGLKSEPTIRKIIVQEVAPRMGRVD